MALLRHLAIVALAAGCYNPDLRDCAVTCTAQTGCADGEVCGADGLCSGPGVTCNHEAIDAANHATVDAHETPDATVVDVSLHLMIMGSGRVIVNTTLTCDSQGSQNGNCTFSVPAHVASNLFAMAEQANHPFMMWSGTGCTGSLPQCTFTPTQDITIDAMFH